MAQAKQEIFGPSAMAAAAANLVAPAAVGAGAVGYTATAHRILIRQINITNKTGVAATYALYKGLTGGSAAGTEIAGPLRSVAAYATEPLYFSPALVLEGTSGFLSGLASGAATMTFVAFGEVVPV